MEDGVSVDGPCSKAVKKLVKNVADSFSNFRESRSSRDVGGTIDCLKYSKDYPMTSKGICYIFNQKVFDIKNELGNEKTKLKERSGTNVDANLLKNFFKAINFDVFTFNDCDIDTFMFNLQEVCQKDFSEYSCFVCCILTYEAEPNVIYSMNGTYPTKRVFEKFFADNCRSLIGKPKIFFIQACVNDSIDSSVQKSVYQSTDSRFEDSYEIHTVADFLVVYSTVPGFYSWKNSSKGSWFIEALCQTLQRHSGSMDLLQLLKIVNSKVLHDYQEHFGYEAIELARVPCVTSTLTRNIMLPVPCSSESEFLNSDSVFPYESENYVLNCTKKGTSKGKVYIFNNEKFKKNGDRLGTDKDVKCLTNFFRKPEFDVQTFPDLKKEDILKEITNVASMSHEDFGCFICCILTHGDDGDSLSDGDDYYEINDIFSPFYDKWVGKPKIYFIQACRGGLLNSGVKVCCKQSTDGGDCNEKNDYNFIHFTHPDFLIAYATVPGEVSMRNLTNGSWFIQTLCKALKEHGTNMNLLKLLTIVHRNVAINFKSYSDVEEYSNKKQVPCLTSTLTKNVIF